MTERKQDKFEKGWAQVPKGIARSLYLRICADLGRHRGKARISKVTFYNRLHGKAEWTRQEALLVEKAFRDLTPQIKQIWG